MPNDVYSRLSGLLSAYVGEEKAQMTLQRQLARCSATPDSLTLEHVKTITDFLIGAMSLYIRNKETRSELTEKIRSFR